MVELAFTERGSGPAVVLLHAFPLHSAMWNKAAELLADRWRVITPDLRGFGGSPVEVKDAPSLDLIADDVVALLDRLGLERVVLGGASMGGYVAMSFLRRYADRVATLALINTKPGADTPEAQQNRDRIATALEAFRTPEPLFNLVDTLLGEHTRGTNRELVIQVRDWIKAVDPIAAAWAQRAMAARPDSRSVLSGATCRAVVIAGEEDALTPLEEARAMAELFRPPAIFHVVPEAGHLSVLEQPERAMRELGDALERVTRAVSGG
jgi:pimeloyl-ACP methyl ester carboxylesterase